MKVLIIGAGISGLASAYWLGRAGYETEVLESGEKPGGRMVTLKRNGDRLDVGAQFYHTNFKHCFGLMTAMKMSGERTEVTGSMVYRLRDGSVRSYPRGTVYMDLLGLKGNLKLYWNVIKLLVFGTKIIPYHINDPIPDSDRVAVLDHFNKESDRALRDFLIFPLAVGATMGPPEYMSLYHFIRALHTFAISHHVCLARGVASLAEALAKVVGVQYGSPVKRLVMEKGKVIGAVMENGQVRKADQVIVALDSASAARIMPEELPEERRFFESIIYSPAPMPVFFLDRPLPGNIWNYWSDPRLKRTFLFAIDGRAKVPQMCPSGKSVLTFWAVLPQTQDLMKQPDSDLIKQANEDAELMIPGVSGWIEDIRIVRLPYATEQYPPGAYQRVMDFKHRAEKLEGISFAGSLLGGTNMESAAGSAFDAVARVRKALGS
ncbi:MAG: FAD-dependent oxidoreductase [Deltaproteobacteria bacterium]|nr:FAD-dependent oxidoreductase [Deltaproteobacteria bacterium]